VVAYQQGLWTEVERWRGLRGDARIDVGFVRALDRHDSTAAPSTRAGVYADGHLNGAMVAYRWPATSPVCSPQWRGGRRMPADLAPACAHTQPVSVVHSGYGRPGMPKIGWGVASRRCG